MGTSSSRAHLKERRASEQSARSSKRDSRRVREHGGAPPSRPDDELERRFEPHPPPKPTPHAPSGRKAAPPPRAPPGGKKDRAVKKHNKTLLVDLDEESSRRNSPGLMVARPPPLPESTRKRLEEERSRKSPPKPERDSLATTRSVVAAPPPGAYPPPMTAKQSQVVNEMMLDELPDLESMDLSELYDPWSAVSHAHRVIYFGVGNGSHVCMKCHHEVVSVGTEQSSIPRILNCSECQHLTTDLISNQVRMNEEGASDLDWAIYNDDDGFLKWKRVFTQKEEEDILLEEKRLLALTDDELHTELENLGADVSHYNGVENKEGLVQIALVFKNWAHGQTLQEGYLVDYNSGKLQWIPVGKKRIDPQQSVAQFRLTADDVYDAATKPFWFRLAWFKQQLARLRIHSDEGPLRIRLRREHILEDSSNCLMTMKPKQLWRSAKYEFVGEPGMDSGGVAREWFSEVSNQIFEGGFGLFEYLGDTEGRYRVNPSSGIVNKLHIQYFRFAGRLLGKALFENCSVNGHLTRDLYKVMIGKPMSLSDIKHVDPQVWRSVQQIVACEDVSVLALNFTYTENAFGAVNEIELKEGGSDIDVTNENLHEYLKLLLEHIMFSSSRLQLAALLMGFYDVIPQALLAVFSAAELELVMCGQSNVDVQDWKTNTTYRGKYKEKGMRHKRIKWFWEIVESLSESEKSNLVRFCTGTPRVPVQGFSALQGGSGMLLFNIESISKETSIFPRAHTCFNRLELPLYDSKEEMEHFVREAIKIESGFNLE